MRVFASAAHAAHTPQFFLVRGEVRPNYEAPARAEALLGACIALGLDIADAPTADLAALGTIHAPDYLAFLRDAPAEWAALPSKGPELVANIHPTPEMLENGARPPAGVVGRLGWYATDAACPIGPHTFAAACAAAGLALAAADAAALGRTSYALTRPPGHHAYPARAGGHCYLNNAALAAERLRARGAARVAVLDIDAHHGNGTQAIFWARDDVVTVSLHGDPDAYYPWFVGRPGERGAGPGAGCNLNLPLPRGSDDAAWLAALAHGVEVISRCGVDALVLSLGFDASIDEPLSFLSVSEDGFARAGERIGALGLPCAIVQEGGYNVARLGPLLTRFLTGLAA
jgi:acetoin utilization deacetylase AcuC-like enzyme